MIDFLERISAALCQKKVTAPDIAADIGGQIEDQGKNMPLVVQPTAAGLGAAKVMRVYGKKEPSHVNFHLDVQAGLRVADLASAFGSYQEMPKPGPTPNSHLMFAEIAGGKTHTCSLIAEAAPSETGLDDAKVLTITLRRDIRLT